MFTTEDFTAKYETYHDEELYLIYKNANEYSEEARKALRNVLEKKGGLEALLKRLEEKAIIENEKIKIANEAAKFGLEGIDASFMKNTTSSAILSKEEVNQIIEKNIAIAEAVVEDKKVNAETIVKSLLGCGLASLIGGAFVSLQVLYFGATSVLMVIGTGLICYGTVKLVTKKSFNNSAVLISSFAAFVLAHLLAGLAYQIFGYLG
jgi:hypothetical protein